MELFGSSKRLAPVKDAVAKDASKTVLAVANASGKETKKHTFAGLGLCDWICHSVAAMGFRKPTDIQEACIPSVMAGKDVMGCAETGSGKTAAFALPILHHLSADPFGIFAIILTPTRELAIQIHEQFVAFGTPMGVKLSLIIGGASITEQGLSLNSLPHIVIATPGRLRHHLMGPSPPNLSRVQYIVLDEADRLLTSGFESELKTILSCSNPRRRTLLFSATLTESLSELETLAMKDTVKYDLTLTQRVPTRLLQQYLFLPSQVKLCYLVGVIRSVIIKQQEALENADSDDETGNKSTSVAVDLVKEYLSESQNGSKRKRSSLLDGGSKHTKQHKKQSNRKSNIDLPSIKSISFSIIIFVGACKKCEEVAELLRQLDFDCVSLHSMLTQNQRLAALNKFKNLECRILVATDVASRGLDIPQVELVINVDLPKVVSDYVHRVGRCARAGRAGRSLSLVSQYDVTLLHAVEEYTGIKLDLSTEVTEEDVVPLLNPVSKAMRQVQMKLMENGFEDKIEERDKRRKSVKRKKLRQYAADAAEATTHSSST